MPVTVGLSLPIDRFQLGASALPAGQGVPILDVHGPYRAAYELSESVSRPQPAALFVGHLPLERVFVPHYLQEQQLRQSELGVQRRRVERYTEAVPAELLLVYVGIDNHRRPAEAAQ